MAKSAQAFRTISEAADEIGVAQHVLRFWETKFTFIRPMKRAGGRRFYRPSDIAVLATVRRLLHQDGYTIKNLQQFHRDHGLKGLISPEPSLTPVEPGADDGPEQDPFDRPWGRKTERLKIAIVRLQDAKTRLDALLGMA